jgi:hypothetical protein
LRETSWAQRARPAWRWRPRTPGCRASSPLPNTEIVLSTYYNNSEKSDKYIEQVDHRDHGVIYLKGYLRRPCQEFVSRNYALKQQQEPVNRKLYLVSGSCIWKLYEEAVYGICIRKMYLEGVSGSCVLNLYQEAVTGSHIKKLLF